MKNEKEITIGKKQYRARDEWSAYFGCPNCKNKYTIQYEDNYCKNCGIKIKFSKAAIKIAKKIIEESS